MPNTHRLPVGEKVSLDSISPHGKDYCDDRDKAEAEFKKLRHRLIERQPALYAEQKQSLLVVFQAMDAGGKDSGIRKAFSGVNPQGVRVHSFKEPSKEELAHDFLWRIHQKTPANGMIGVFNRSHYENVLVCRVDKIEPESIWRRHYDEINQFEKLLADSGTTIVKFYLHISKKEQKERFQDRLDEPEKNWKFSMGDLRKREQWDDYRKAYEEALTRCNTQWAPWYAIPADQKWYRNLAIARILVDTLEQMNPQYPPPEPGLDKVKL